ncbi:MAG: hypothetical protein ACYCWC_08690 [Rhodocyclaceae bacterium]
MNIKLITGLVGLVGLLAFLAPPLLKLKSLPLTLVVLVGVAMAAYEFIEHVRGKEE